MDKQRAAILTFHAVPNYGAVLQAYALKEHLRRLGYKPCIVDYRPVRLMKPYGLIRNRFGLHARNIVNLVNKIVFRRFINQRLDLCSFEVLRRGSRATTDDGQMVFIVGSDQVWNPEALGGKLDPTFLLDFVVRPQRRIAYAASFGGNIPSGVEGLLIQSLGRFDAVSVRESSVVEPLSKLISREVACVSDPVALLYGRWSDIMKKPTLPLRRRHVMVYSVSFDRRMYRMARLLAADRGCTLTACGASWNPLRSGLVNRFPTPERWLWLIGHAEVVCVNSFHGVLFSILFERRFLFFPLRGAAGSRNRRVLDLLKGLGLEERIVDDRETDDEIRRRLENTTDFATALYRLRNSIVESSAWLSHNLH